MFELDGYKVEGVVGGREIDVFCGGKGEEF